MTQLLTGWLTTWRNKWTFFWLVNWLTDLQTNCKGRSPSVQGWSVTMLLLLRPTPGNKGRRVSDVKDLEIQLKKIKISTNASSHYLLWCDKVISINTTNYRQTYKKRISTWLGTLVGFRLSSRLNMCRHRHLNMCRHRHLNMCRHRHLNKCRHRHLNMCIHRHLNMCRHRHLNMCWNFCSAVCSLQQKTSLCRLVAVSTPELHLTRGEFPPGLGLYRLALREIFSCMDTLIMLAAL